MQIFKRFGLFMLTNLLIMMTISIVFSFLAGVLHLNHLGGYLPMLILFSVVWGMGGSFISLFMSKFLAKSMMGVQVIDPLSTIPRDQELLQTVHALAQKAGLRTMPEVGIYEAPEINAFATGPSRSNCLVAVSTGLLGAMNHDEIEGVLGHEVAHIANGDMVTMTLIQGIINSFALFFSRILADLLSQNFEERSRYLIRSLLAVLFDIGFTILGSLVVNYFSRQREFRADAGGARFAGKEKMIRGLRRLQMQFEQIEPDNSGVATLKITSRPAGLMAFFSTHPPLEERIARLQKQA